MNFEFGDEDLEEAYYDPRASLGHGPAVNKGFRKVVDKIAAAVDERDLRALKGLHYHKLEGKRSHQHGLDLTDQWRLIVERVKEDGQITLMITSVEDYH
ncbi:MAG: type II toxin-antitoxin system RelE/ParE family toxin [Anaerolineales bacterium]